VSSTVTSSHSPTISPSESAATAAGNMLRRRGRPCAAAAARAPPLLPPRAALRAPRQPLPRAPQPPGDPGRARAPPLRGLALHRLERRAAAPARVRHR